MALFIDCPLETPMSLPSYALDDTLKTYYLPFGKPLLEDRLKNSKLILNLVKLVTKLI